MVTMIQITHFKTAKMFSFHTKCLDNLTHHTRNHDPKNKVSEQNVHSASSESGRSHMRSHF